MVLIAVFQERELRFLLFIVPASSLGGFLLVCRPGEPFRSAACVRAGVHRRSQAESGCKCWGAAPGKSPVASWDDICSALAFPTPGFPPGMASAPCSPAQRSRAPHLHQELTLLETAPGAPSALLGRPAVLENPTKSHQLSASKLGPGGISAPRL